MVCVLPPPLSGMTTVSLRMIERFRTELEPRVYAVSRPAWAAGRLWLLVKHLLLIGNVLVAIFRARRGDSFYLAPDARLGLLGTLTMVGLFRLRGGRLVLHHHVFSYVDRRPPLATALFALAGRGALHIVLCPLMGRRLREQYGRHLQVFVQSNSGLVPAALARPVRNAVACVGYLGALTPDKGIDTFLVVARRLAARHPALRFDIAGPGASVEMAAAVAAFVAEDPARRAYWGAVDEAGRTRFLAGCDVLLFPSRYRNEAEPLVLHEAARHGVVTLARAVGCIGELGLDPSQLASPAEDFVGLAEARIEGWIARPLAFQQAWRATLPMAVPPALPDLPVELVAR